MLYPSMSLFAIMEHPSMTQSSSTFAIKCSWQIVYVLINFAKVVVVAPSCYESVLAMVCLFIMSSCWVYAQFVMQCLVVSAQSSQTCLRNSVLPCSSFLLSLNLLTKLAMFTWLPLYFLIPFDLWSARDFCSMLHVVFMLYTLLPNVKLLTCYFH